MANQTKTIEAERQQAMKDAILTLWCDIESHFPFIMFKKCIAEYEELTGDVEFKRSLLDQIK
jgi:hypothetical protein